MTRFFIPFIVLWVVLTTMPSHAQEVTKAEMASIRAAYSAAKEQVERNSHAQEQDEPRSDMEIVSHYVIPGCGPTEEVIHYYFTLGEDPVLGTTYYKIYFISTSYNVAARKFYQEFLFGEEESDLLFFFQSNDALDGSTDETRYYYGKSGVHKSIMGTAELDEVFAARKADELKTAFNLLMNQDY
ncbi:MAG: hypothetical protein IJG42_01180 [Muribaculaceae bacterium]|nr:hypothetical protein [Muribaculaceae bacterium]